jgi:hypothetical protein
MTSSDELDRFASGIQQVQLTIVDRFTPAIEGAGDAFHVLWYVTQPWPRRWWHLVTGHRTPGYCLTHRFRESTHLSVPEQVGD